MTNPDNAHRITHNGVTYQFDVVRTIDGLALPHKGYHINRVVARDGHEEIAPCGAWSETLEGAIAEVRSS